MPLRKLGEPRPASGYGSSGDQRACPDSLSQNLDTSSPLSASSYIRDPSAASSTLASSTDDSLPARYVASMDVGALQKRIKELEEQLSKAVAITRSSDSASGQSTATAVNETYLAHIHSKHESRLFGSSHIINRGVMHKNRLYGQSHWGSGIAHVAIDILELIEPHVRIESSKIFTGMERCKAFGRIIKWQRAPPWPTPPTTDLPSRDVADKLIDGYLRTIETVHRILHVPTFRKDYEAIWAADSTPDTGFLIQVKLVLAIGSTVYDEQFSFRPSALKWVYQAQTWISEPEFKAQLSLQYLQTCILLILARESTSIGEDFTWITTGALIRAAVYMGLHRDPVHLPKRTPFGAEMRRRLWNTILEISLHSSMLSGGPPLMSLTSFDTDPPGNFDDEQLMTENPVPKPGHEFSHTTIARALRRTWEIRLAIAKFLNDLTSTGTYDEALRLDREFRAFYKELSRTLHTTNLKSDCSRSQFTMNYLDFIMQRYLMSIHIPFLGPDFHTTTYAFSRRVVIDTSLRLWTAIYPISTLQTAQSDSNRIPKAQSDLARLTMCGNGFLRTTAFQASLLLAGELLMQLKEDEGLGPATLRPDLLAVLKESKDWSFECIQAGETNIKGYLLSCLLAAYLDGLMRGLRKDELPGLLIKAAEDAEIRCSAILEQMAAHSQSGSNLNAPLPLSPDSLVDPMSEWDYMISDDQFNFGSMDPMNWLLDDEQLRRMF
ncbi:uncharacterized protein A1O9_06321 [Exophiala aquamarina CBS 119918]|uniref:Xylanolytic transcriptional activator regulatory domain-containing protein n=1 Tax=Exophiala aquamarina CBS 119918 TaxID=1182545 RepID=A0A072PSA9_9EURO|nr:uncharacterized protein A1O9_06321 [Exophiala aquamarina CBS 119918]KEF58395.1 hypothetical protein A1O9_06321 [Exophiala aquamarina CBS 119918]